MTSTRFASSSSASPRLAGLDLLRAAAILLVLVWHLPLSMMPFRWKPATWSGVDLFFVLSGYLIGTHLLKPYSRQARPSFIDFFLRRAIRILPLYLVVLALYFMLPAWRESPGLAPIWKFLTFTLNFGLDASQHGAFSHCWSLCVEEHFYLLLPLAVYLLMRKPTAFRAIVLTSGLMIAGMLCRAALWTHYIAPLSSSEPKLEYRFLEYIYYPTYNRLDGLVIGVVIAGIRLFRPKWWELADQHGNAFLFSGIVVLVASFWTCQTMVSFATAVFGFPMLAISYGLLVVGALSPSGVLYRPRFTGYTTIALLSYSIYLTHKEIMHLDNRFILPLLPGITKLAVLVVYASTFAAAAGLSYLLIERTSFILRDRVLSPSLKAIPVMQSAQT